MQQEMPKTVADSTGRQVPLYYDPEQGDDAPNHAIRNPGHLVTVQLVINEHMAGTAFVRVGCQTCEWWNDLV
jgi:hypothetical protein